MDVHIDHLVQIKNYIQQAHLCGEEGIARLHYIRAIILVKELSMNLNNYMMALDSVGEQPNEALLD